MRRLHTRLASALVLVATGFAPPLAAATARVATTASTRDFLAGEALGTAISADGTLTLGVPLASRAWPEDAADAVPFAAVADGSGRVYVATGGGVGRLFVSAPDGRTTLLWTAPEPNVTALVIAPDGAVVCGTSPRGKVWRIDAKGKATPIGDPSEAAIWALAYGPDGTLYAGTGEKGRVYRMKPGEKDLAKWVDVDDTHVRSLAALRDGRVVAGTSDRGMLVNIAPDGTMRTLHDFSRPEVVAVVEGKDGVLYAAATNAEAPALGEGRERAAPAAGPAPAPTPAPGSAPKPDETPKGSVSISTGPPRVTPMLHPKEATGGAEIVAVAKDGFVEPAWTYPDETIYSMRWDGARGGLVVTTGARGRVYLWKDRHVTLEAQTDQKQAVAAPAVGGSFAVVTMNSPGLFRPATGPRTGTFTSPARDTNRMSRFTRIRYEGTAPAGTSIAFAVRGGNSEKPDATWTPWTNAAGDARRGAGATLPAARYFQWKATLTGPASGATPEIERVELAYSERNARPVLENLAVLEPGSVYQRGGGGGSAVLSVTNPDENGIYAGLEAPAAEGPGKKLWRKGFRTLTWKANDPNGDSLRYEVEARREGETVWFPIRRDLEETWLSFDTTAMPDGRYRFRVTASDRVSNPEAETLAAQEESAIALVDNTPPVLEVRSRKVEKGEVVVAFAATDALSPVARAEAALNADRWRQVPPEDGASDTPSESYVFRAKKPDGPCVVALRVLDAAGNPTAAQVEFP